VIKPIEQDVLMKKHSIYILATLLALPYLTYAEQINKTEKPPIQLPVKFKQKAIEDINQYWISEKLDGVRGYWTGKELLTKNGNKLNVPAWFTLNWPLIPLDGELWIKRNTFQQVVSCVRRKIAGDCWQSIRFMVFDLPLHPGNFSERIKKIKQLIPLKQSPYISIIPQYKVDTNDALFNALDRLVDNGSEGLMLHHEKAFYQAGRSHQIMKLKRYDDAEAIVIKHIAGKGKFRNLLGAIQVKTTEGIIFNIGTGFTNKERANPPAINSVITFKYVGKTQKGVPKFASFLRQRTIGNP